jgi:hypothetical protein
MTKSIWDVQVRETTQAPGVRLQSQAFRVILPFNTRFIWNRPLAVLTTTPQGEELRLPVQDLTRWVQIILAFSVLGVIILMSVLRRKQA